MPEQVTGRIPQLYRLAYSLIFARTVPEILEAATEALSKSLQVRNTFLWQFSAKEGSLFPAQFLVEDKAVKTKSVPLGSDYLGEVFRNGKPIRLTAEFLRRPNQHFQLPKEVIATTGLCVPFKQKEEMQGVVELIDKMDGSATFDEDDLDFAAKAMELVSVAAANMKTIEDQSRRQLNAITRLTLLYDIGQIFNSTLELDKLLPIITEKIRDILDAETCTIWFMDDSGEGFHYGYSTGAYQEMFSTYRAKFDEDIAGEVLQSREGILLENAVGDERFQNRFSQVKAGAGAAQAEAQEEEIGAYTYMASPLECKGKLLGTLEVMNRVNVESLFSEEDLYLLNDLSYQAAVSIHNANLLQAERKAKELDALLEISHAITSTLNLDKVLLTIVNQSATLMTYDRAAIAMFEREKLELAAVSGRMEIDKKTPEMKDLQEILTWSAHLGKGLYISEYDGKIATDREENREKFKAYFERTEMKSFVSLPLKDEEGDLGILSFESATPYFLDERHLEVASILANQATVAIRNAQLYRQIPLMNIMEPIMQKKAKLMKLPRSRRIAMAVAVVMILAILIFVPWNMTVVGDVTVLPARRTPVVTEVEGIIKNVYFRESAQVNQGDVIASLDDRDYRLALEEEKTQKDLLLKQISRSLNLADSGALRIQQIQLEQALKEIEFYQQELDRTRILAPVDGVIITPKIEERIGYLLKKGEEFCEMADMHLVRAEVAIGETDMSYLQTNQEIRLKMNAFPTRKFYGTTTHLGAQMSSPANSYRIEAQIENPELSLKSGMVGKAKVKVGYHSIGYVILRKPVRFFWKKFWVWLP